MVDEKGFIAERSPRFGTDNPTRMDCAFWIDMVGSNATAYAARETHGVGEWAHDGAIWCFERFGATRTLLPGGRVICIAGEHEDSYDPDFHIYNDVIVIRPDGG
jgi:hypothetical protein